MYNALKRLNVEVKVSSDINEIKTSDALILPGVGAFGAVMKNLVKYKDVVYNHIDDDKPLLGICLGLHMLFLVVRRVLMLRGWIYLMVVQRNLTYLQNIKYLIWDGILQK